MFRFVFAKADFFREFYKNALNTWIQAISDGKNYGHFLNFLKIILLNKLNPTNAHG